jgi:hypothetical protein
MDMEHPEMNRSTIAAVMFGMSLMHSAGAEDHILHEFKIVPLTDVYYSEGAGAGDINGDGSPDVVYGPYWFQGPEFRERHKIFQPVAQPREAYANHFFAWVYDFNGDGLGDILTAGFPGTPAYVYENPGPNKLDELWKRHEVLDSVCNESPQLVNVAGDERPEFLCTHDGYFGYASVDWSQPFDKWKFQIISARNAPRPFGHGLGAGDINGDGRIDILTKDGWFEQPVSRGEAQWKFYKTQFAGPGGAEMYAYDVDGDGDNDVITSLAAHEFGLSWHEQLRNGEEIAFREHLIMGGKPADSKYGLVFSELHSVNLVDVDGDGLRDIVTGKTFWSHHTKSPMWDTGAVVYWFKLVRGPEGADWVPYQAAEDTGIGRQVTVVDLNGDKLPEIVLGGMKGGHVLLHQKREVGETEWQKAKPVPR